MGKVWGFWRVIKLRHDTGRENGASVFEENIQSLSMTLFSDGRVLGLSKLTVTPQGAHPAQSSDWLLVLLFVHPAMTAGASWTATQRSPQSPPL